MKVKIIARVEDIYSEVPEEVSGGVSLNKLMKVTLQD